MQRHILGWQMCSLTSLSLSDGPQKLSNAPFFKASFEAEASMGLLPKGCVLSMVRAWGRLPPKIPQWRNDYFELKLLDQQPVQEGHVDPPWSPRIQGINLPCKKCPP